MWKIILKILEKKACSHDYKRLEEHLLYENHKDKLPHTIITIYVCKKCGKIKKIKV